MDIDVIIKSLSRNTLGSNLLAKFGSNDSPILLTDIICPKGNIDNSIGKLLTNDSMA